MTFCSAKRGTSFLRRCCVCSMRKRRSFGPFFFATPRVDVEELHDRLVADRVDLDLEARGVGAGDPLLDLRERDRLGGVDARVARIVRERLEHDRGAGAERAVHEALHAADFEPLVLPVLRLRLLRGRPVGERRPVVDAHRQAARLADLVPGRQVQRIARQVLDGRHAVLRGVVRPRRAAPRRPPPACAPGGPSRAAASPRP